MKILFINTNQIVQKLIEVTAQKANVELVSINNIKQITDTEQYDYIIIDDDCYNADKSAYDSLIAGHRACLIYSKSDEMPTGFSEYVKKPFIPTHILNIMIEEISKLQTQESFAQDSVSQSHAEPLDSRDLAQDTAKDEQPNEALAQVSEDTLLDDLDLGEIEEVDAQEGALEQELEQELSNGDDSSQEDLEDLLEKAKALTETLDSHQEQTNESEQSDANTAAPQVLDSEQINEVSDLLHEIETSSPKPTQKQTLEQTPEQTLEEELDETTEQENMQDVSAAPLQQDLAQDTANDLTIDDFSLDTLDEESQDLDNGIPNDEKALDSKLSDDELFDSIDALDPKDDLSQQKDEQLQDFQALDESQILQALGESPKATAPKALDSKSEALASALSQSIEQSLTNLQNSEIKTLLDGMEVTISINFKDKSNG